MAATHLTWRDRVDNYIAAHPGATVREVSKALHLRRNVVMEHVLNLLLHGRIAQAGGDR
jgi:predicted transcriptional regulator